MKATRNWQHFLLKGGVGFLVDYLDLDDASITASSERNVNHAAKRVRINRYLDNACAWAAAGTDNTPWVQFDMEQEVTAWGLLVKLPCGEPQTSYRVTALKVTMSQDGVRWNDVSGTLTMSYTSHQESTSWFDEPATSRNWKLQVIHWNGEPTMKADLFGQPKGNR